MIVFRKREVLHLVLATLVLGFVFGFDDKQSVFNLSYWLLNFFRFCMISFAVLLSYALAQKLSAEHYGCSSEFRVWGVRRFGFRPGSKFPLHIEIFNLKIPIHSFPLGLVLAVVISFLTRGKFFFAAVASFEVVEHRFKRVGKKYVNITSGEVARISLSGVFASLLVAFLASLLGLDSVVLVASVFAAFQMVPFSTLDGCRVFFSSPALFAFSAVFVVLSALLLNFVSAPAAVFYSLISAGVFFILFFYYRVYSAK